jgi:hypothetical protein
LQRKLETKPFIDLSLSYSFVESAREVVSTSLHPRSVNDMMMAVHMVAKKDLLRAHGEIDRNKAEKLLK